MPKLVLTDTAFDAVIKMSQGNPGALAFMMEFIKAYPDEWIVSIMHFDDMDIHGSKLYMIWNDCCNRDCKLVKLLIHNLCHGNISREEIIKNVSQGRGTPFHLKTIEELDAISQSDLYTRGEDERNFDPDNYFANWQ